MALSSNRRLAALALMAGTCYLTQGQEVNVFGFHFTAIRVVLLFGTLATLGRGEFGRLQINSIDKCLLAYAVMMDIIVEIGSGGSTNELVFQLGCTYDILLPYFLFRCFLQNSEEIEEFLAGLALLIAPYALMVIVESFTGHSVFTAFGGLNSIDEYRDGHYRCSGTFRSPITGGTLGATLMPLFAGLYGAGRRRSSAVIGMLASLATVICSRSSGPLLAFGGGIFGLALWRYRENVQTIRRAFYAGVVGLHLYMKAPVWFLMGRISDIVGGGGWHRAEVVDEAVQHFRSWWLVGTYETGGWMATQLADGGADLTNQFVVAGVRGGLWTLLIFIYLFILTYRNLGLAMHKIRNVTLETEKLLWAMGAALLATVINFFSVSYFDQIKDVWYMLLAMIASSSFYIFKNTPDDPLGAKMGGRDFEGREFHQAGGDPRSPAPPLDSVH